MLSFWWKFHHWLHWKLSIWQLSVQPMMKISSKWRYFRVSVADKSSKEIVMMAVIIVSQALVCGQISADSTVLAHWQHPNWESDLSTSPRHCWDWQLLVRASNFLLMSLLYPPLQRCCWGVYWFHLVRLSVCGQNRVRSVSSTILARSISF